MSRLFAHLKDSNQRKGARRLRDAVICAREQTQGEGSELSLWAHGKQIATMLEQLAQLESTRQAWDERLDAFIEEPEPEAADYGLEPSSPFERTGGASPKKASQRPTVDRIPSPVADLTIRLPPSLRQKLETYRLDRQAKQELQARCRVSHGAAKPAGRVDWVQYNRVHLMEASSEAEELQRACDAELRRARHQLVASASSVHGSKRWRAGLRPQPLMLGWRSTSASAAQFGWWQ